MSGIQRVRMTFFGGTEEEIRSVTDAITLVLIEHGIKIGGELWDDDIPPD